MPARCGVQKKSRNFALSGGGHARLCPLAGKSADLPVRRRTGNFMSNGANVGFTCVYAKFWGGYFAGLCCRTCFSRIWGQVANAEDWWTGAEAGGGSEAANAGDRRTEGQKNIRFDVRACRLARKT